MTTQRSKNVLYRLLFVFCLASPSSFATLPEAPKPPSVADKVAASKVVFVGTIRALRYRSGIGPLVELPSGSSGWNVLGRVTVDEVLLNKGSIQPSRVYVSILNNRRLSPEQLQREFVGERFIFFGAFQRFLGSGEEGAYYLAVPGWSLSPEGLEQLDAVKDTIRSEQRVK